MVEERLYLIKNGECWFNDFVLVVDGDSFRYKNLNYIHLGDKTTTVGASTFEGNHLSQIHFHKKIKKIGTRAFAKNKIEKIIFSRLEAPVIEKDAFAGNPVSLIIVPYETKDDYIEVLKHVEFENEVKIISNIEMKFNKLYEKNVQDTLIFIEARPIYGQYYWRIEKEEIVDIDAKLKKKTNRYVCEQVELNGVHYQICKDIMQQLLIYRKENDQYVDLQFEDFEVIFNYIGKEIL